MRGLSHGPGRVTNTGWRKMMQFLSEDVPPRGVATEMAPGIRRMVAENPSKMTYHGTNTYLLDTEAGVVVVDPGPDLPAHLEAVLRAAGRVAAIVATHSHHDHVQGLPRLRAATGAPVFAFGQRVAADQVLDDGQSLFGWKVLHTPGHLDDHVCLLRNDGVLLSGDHVMGWSSSVVLPPEGDMADYMAALERLLGEPASVYLPGHGPAIARPHDYVRDLLAHRHARERQVLAALDDGLNRIPAMVARIYADLPPALHGMAGRNVEAHLRKLAREGRAVESGESWAIPAPRSDSASPG
jgi:glyoxylase-like metal-dependent hydrolase (beta-lactamase superfamily II)